MLRKHICLMTIFMALFCLCSSSWAVSADIPNIWDNIADQENAKPSSMASVSPIPMSLEYWQKDTCGNWEQTTDGIKVYGAGYRIGNSILSRTQYNMADSELLIKFRVNGNGTYTGIGCGISSVIGEGGTTSWSYEGSTVYAINTWYYTRIRIHPDKSYQIVTATGNYDINGGTIFKSSSGTIPNESWPYVENAIISAGIGDNYGGAGAFMEIGQISFNAQEILLQESTTYDFESGVIPSDFSVVGGQWTIDSTGYQSGKSLYSDSYGSIKIEVTNAGAVSFYTKVVSGTNYCGASMFIDDFAGHWLGASYSDCWHEIKMNIPTTGTHTITWKVDQSSYCGTPAKVWIDNVKIWKTGSSEKTYGGSLDDYGRSIEKTTDGGYIIGGSTASFGSGKSDGYLIKIDASGNKSWEKYFGGQANDSVNDVIQTADGGFALLGDSLSYGSSRGKFWLVKTDITGNKQWEKTYGGSDLAGGKAFQQTSDGGFILLGNTTETDPWLDFRLTKVDANGNEQWTKYFGRNLDDTGHDIKITPDGGYLLVGYSGMWSSNLQAWIIKTDAAGNKLWDTAWGGTGSEIGNGCSLTNDGGYLVVGSTSSSGAGGNDGLLLKLNASGQEQWHKTFGTTGDDYFSKVYQRPNGNIVCVGSTADINGHSDVWVVETDANGNKLATQTFGGNGNDYGYDLAKISDGYALVGATDSIGAGALDVYFIASNSLSPSSPSITGSVKTASGAGISGVTITFSNSGGTATADASGNYSVTVASGYSGTATPSKTGYTFSPATKSYSNLTTNQTGQDYTGTPPPVVVSGSVKTASATGVSGVLITFSNSGGTATTDSSGNYSITVPNGYTGTATPSKTGYTFSPATRTYSNLTADQTGQDYTATPLPVLVSGSLKTASGEGVSGVLITFSSSGGTATTDVSGIYSLTVPNGYSGTATPSKTGYTFSPATRTYSNLTADQTGQDYTATPPPVAISGSVKTASGTGVSGVLIAFSGSGGTASTDASGSYSITMSYGYSGTATPSKTGYTFSPATRTYSNGTADPPGSDYVATPPPVAVSGSVKTASGTGVSGVLITFSNSGGTATTDVSGIYSITVANGYTGTATPSKTGYTFDPASKAYSNVTSPKTGENYTSAPISNPTIGSNSIDAIDVIKITDMSGVLPDVGGVVTIRAWDKDGKQLTTAGYVSPVSVLNHGTTSIPGRDIQDRFPDGTPAAYTFSVESSKMFITNVNNSIDGAVKVPIIYSNGLSNFVSNSIGSRNTLKLTDMSGTIASSGIAITVTAWDASGKAIPESTSAVPLKLNNHGTTTILGATLPARFPSGTPMTYEFTIASPKLIVSNVKNSSDGNLNIPTVYTVGVSSFVSNSIGSRNTIYISDFSGTLDIGGAAIKVRAWDVSGTEIPESVSGSSYKIYNYETVKITGAELGSRFSSGVPMTYEFTVDSSNVVITNVKSSTDGSINIPTVYTSGITNYTTNYVSDLNTIRITDMSGSIPSGGGSITIIARDGVGTLIPESGSATALKLNNHGTTTIEGNDLRNRFPNGTPVTFEFSIGSSSAVVTNLTESTDGTINIPTVFTLGPCGGI